MKSEEVPGSKLDKVMNSQKRVYFSIFEVLEVFDKDLEEPRTEKIYSSGDQGVKKDLGGN